MEDELEGRNVIVCTGLPGLGKTKDIAQGIYHAVAMPKPNYNLSKMSVEDIRANIEYEEALVLALAELPVAVVFDRLFIDEMVFPTTFGRVDHEILYYAARNSLERIAGVIKVMHYTVPDSMELARLLSYLKTRKRSLVDDKWTAEMLRTAERRFMRVYEDYHIMYTPQYRRVEGEVQ